MTASGTGRSLAIIEARGLVTIVAALDAMDKEADVEFVGIRGTGGGFLVMAVEGHLAAIRSAVRAAEVAAGPLADLRFTTTLPRPDGRTRAVFELPWGHRPPDPDRNSGEAADG